ncbi:MAG: ParB N-terminal domain-containing protein, partial [archaeon]
YKSFNEEFEDSKFKSSSYVGIQAIDVNKIVGSVGRSKKIDKNSTRYKNIKSAMNSLEHFHAIKVYKVGDEYYIIDGHHRTEAAKELDKHFIDAEVIEYRFH